MRGNIQLYSSNSNIWPHTGLKPRSATGQSSDWLSCHHFIKSTCVSPAVTTQNVCSAVHCQLKW